MRDVKLHVSIHNHLTPYITLFSPTKPYVQPLHNLFNVIIYMHIPIRGAPGRAQLPQVSAVLNSQMHFSTQNSGLKGSRNSKQTPKTQPVVSSPPASRRDTPPPPNDTQGPPDCRSH